MTPREELIGAASALDVTIAHMHETVTEIARMVGSFRQPDTRAEREAVTLAARSLSVRARTAIAWGADEDTFAELASECRALIGEAATIVDQHRRAVFTRVTGFQAVEGGLMTSNVNGAARSLARADLAGPQTVRLARLEDENAQLRRDLARLTKERDAWAELARAAQPDPDSEG